MNVAVTGLRGIWELTPTVLVVMHSGENGKHSCVQKLVTLRRSESELGALLLLPLHVHVGSSVFFLLSRIRPDAALVLVSITPPPEPDMCGSFVLDS